MQDISQYVDDNFKNAFTLLYCISCKEYRKACENKNENDVQVTGHTCFLFESLAKDLGINDIMTRDFASPQNSRCCATCQEWDALSPTGNDSVLPWNDMPEEERRRVAYSGNCVEVMQAIRTDQSCNYEMMNTDTTFCCPFYEEWKNAKSNVEM